MVLVCDDVFSIPTLAQLYRSVCRVCTVFGPPNTDLGGMDELAAAAAVLSMAVDANAEEETELDSMPGMSGDDAAQKSSMEVSSADKENQGDHPGLGEQRAADPKVYLRS